MSPNSSDRTTEAEIAIAALRIAADQRNGFASTTVLKDRMPDYIQLTPGDLQMSDTRVNEEMYRQIVGNIVSHHDSPGNIINEGYPTYHDGGITITDLGRKHILSKGYSE